MADNTREWTKFGRYALLDKIGSGGMAEIFRAKTFGAAGFEKEFAIKLILPSLLDDAEFVDMFINEAKIAVSLYHANIVQVFDLGELDNQYYIAMEFVHGKDLLDVLARCAQMNIKIPLNLVLFVAMEMLKGLEFAHRAKDSYGDDLNIIHRDVSPSNILISYAGDVKVGDFGVAKAAIKRTLTESGTLKGKVGYMSPEQVMGEEIDSRSDVFSACIVFFEALSMSRLFVGGSDLDVMLRVRDADISAGLDKVGALPRALEDIIHKGLARHREERYQTAGEFYQALVDFCFQHSIKVTGSDLSNLMRRLFAKEIEHEKSQRRAEPRPTHVTPVASSASQPARTPGSTHSGAAAIRKSASAAPASPASSSSFPLDDTAANVKARATHSPHTPHDTGQNKEGTRYQFRDSAGLIFGPMGRKTLVDLLAVRRPRDVDRVSFDGNEWVSLNDIPGLQDEAAAARSSKNQESRQVQVGAAVFRSKPRPQRLDSDTDALDEESSHGLQSPSSVKDTDVIRDLKLAVDAMEEISQAIDPRESSHSQQLDTASTSQYQSPSKQPSSPSEVHIDPREGLDISSSPISQTAPETVQPLLDEIGLASKTLNELKAGYASYEGELKHVSFARILARLDQAKATGRLFVTNDTIEKSIFFRDGDPIYVDSNRKEELLGHFLLSRRLITNLQLNDALARLSEWGGRLGDALVAIGAIPAHEVFRHLSDQMKEKLLDIFTWENGYYGYYENQEPDTQGYSLGIDTYATIAEGCRECIPLDRIKKFYEKRSHIALFTREPAPIHVDRLRLRAQELRVLKQLDSGENLRSLLKKFSAGQTESVYRSIYLLHQVEVLMLEVTETISLPER